MRIPTILTQDQIEGSKQILIQIDEHMAAIPERSDVVHDVLVFFAEQMLKFNKEKQHHEKTFYSLIETTLHIQTQPDKEGRTGLDAVKGKSAIIDFLGDYQMEEPPIPWRAIRRILEENRKMCDVEDFERRLIDLEKAYHDVLNVLLPIKSNLAFLDYTIDQTVYRLYNLTPEEMEVVEDTCYPRIAAARERRVRKQEERDKKIDKKIMKQLSENGKTFYEICRQHWQECRPPSNDEISRMRDIEITENDIIVLNRELESDVVKSLEEPS